MNNLKKAAEILVECGYATIGINGYMESCYWGKGDKHPEEIVIDPFSDTLEGRRQADAIEDWLSRTENKLWFEDSLYAHKETDTTQHQWRLDRIKWCLDNLRGNDGKS